MGARSKRAKIVRQESEFDLTRLAAQLYQPRDGQNTIDSWSLEQIYVAREEQMIGQFVLPSRMAEQMGTDDAIYTAKQKRLAPLRCLPVEIKATQGARAQAIAYEAEALYGANGVGINAGVVADVQRCLVDHGVAFAVCVATPRDDGSRVDLEMKYWPIEYIRWDPVFRIFKARADPNSVQPGDIPSSPYNEYGFVGAAWIPVIHGDGRWIIFKNHELTPFRNDAAILPSALVWARHAFAMRDWSQGSKAHGTAKVIGEMPTGVPLQGPGGVVTAEAQAFMALLEAIARSNSPVGLRPAGSKTDFVVNTSTAWQVWKELVSNAEKAAERIYVGADGTLGTQDNGPGVNATELFGVAKTLVRGDAECISRGIDTGLIQPWCAINFGDSSLAPSRRYVIPNDDEEEVSDDYAKRNKAFTESLVALYQSGITVTPQYVADLAADYRVRAPALALPPAAPPPTPAPTPGAPR